MRQAVGAILLALLTISAGCVGGTGGLGTSAGPGTTTPDATDTPGDTSDGSDDDGSTSSTTESTGTVNFYVSDEPNAMDDFKHLNVTVTSVRFRLVDPADDNETAPNGTTTIPSEANQTIANETVADATATPTPADESNASAMTTVTTTTAEVTDGGSQPENETASDEKKKGDDERKQEQTDADERETDDDAESEQETDADDERETEDDEASENGADEAEADGEDGDDGEGEDGRWVVRDINATTVDLTRLRGENATLVDAFDLPAGEYDQAVLEITEVNGTLTSGESTNVKLPSERLKLNTEFEIASDSDVNFVYDISVHRAGNSGKYILRPVVGESGVDKPVNPVDAKGKSKGRN